MKFIDVLSHILVVSSGLAAPSLPSQSAIRIPLTRSLLPFSKRDGATEKLHSNSDRLGRYFSGSLKIRDTEFQCVFDTGAPHIFVAGKSCSKDKDCGTGPRYGNGGKSLGTGGHLIYGSGEVRGNMWTDDVTFAGVEAKDQSLLVVETVKGLPDSILSVCGMSLDRVAVSGTSTMFSAIMKQGSVKKDEFSFQLGRGDCGELVLGGRDETKTKGTLATIPVSANALQREQQKHWTFWEVQLDAIKIDGTALSNAHLPGRAVIDTGSTGIILRKDTAELVARALGGSIFHEDGTYPLFLPCDLNKSVDFVLGGHSFSVPPSDLLPPHAANTPPAENKHCRSVISAKDRKFAVLGYAFLQGRYAVFSHSANSGSPAVLLGDSDNFC